MSKEKRRVPKLRFPGFTEDWEQRKLGDVTNIKTGSRNQQDSVTNGQYPFFIRSEKIEKLDRYDFDTEAILVPGDGRIGEIFHYYNGKFALHQRVYKVDNFKGVDAFFLLYLFQCSFKEHALRLNAQGTVPSLRLPMFTEWNICIPSLQEQIGIGRLLNKIELMITLHQRKLDNLKLKKKALLQKLFPKNGERYPELRFSGFTDAWEQCKLSDITEVIMGQSPSSKNYTDNPNDDILVQGNADLKDGKVVPRLWTKEITKTIDKGGIILTVRAPVGDVAKTDYKVVLGRGVAGIKGNDYIYQFLQKLQYNRYWVSLSSGSTFESINSNDIKDLIIDIPSIEEQTKISMLLNNVNSIITLHQRKLDHLKLQKKALLQQMFV